MIGLCACDLRHSDQRDAECDAKPRSNQIRLERELAAKGPRSPTRDCAAA